MHLFGFGFEHQGTPPSSEELARAWQPYVDVCVETFSPSCSMFESNFPVDKRSCSYSVLWNAFKRIAEPYSITEKAALFSETAIRTYRLTLE
jgi:L-fuconolactonase